MALNLNNMSVDKNGHVSFSGLSSGIDYQSAVDNIIKAKQIPIDTLNTDITKNQDKISSLNDLQTKLTALKTSLSTLYGAVSYGNNNDVFQAKQAYASSAREDGGTASAAANLLGVTVSNSAPVSSHTLEVLQVAKAHKISSDQFASTTTAVGFSSGDSITVEGTTINFSTADTLADVRDRINAANTGTNATGVSATIVTVSSTENYLVLTKDTTGTDISLTETGGTPLQDLGIFTGASAYKNELQASQKAQFYADGLLDQTNTLYESQWQTASTVNPGTAGTITFTDDATSSTIGTVAYTTSDDLTSIAASITANVTGVTATVVDDGTGKRLEITGSSAFSMSDSGSAVADYGIDNKRRLIERDTNTVDDLFSGMSLNVYQAEPGTTLTLSVEHDLNAIKTAVSDFVTSYNDLRNFINDQRDLQTKKSTTDNTEKVTSGTLFSSQALQAADSALSAIVGGGVQGVNQQYSVLAQIGIDFIKYGTESSTKDKNTLQVDETKLDDALLNSVDNVERMFSFDFSSSDPRITLLGFKGTTQYSSTGYTLNFQPNSGTNDVQYSEQLDNAYWTTNAGTISADSTTSPDGNTTADGLVGDATTGPHYIENATPVTVTSGSSYTATVYAKAGANDSARIQLAGANFPTDTYADVDLSNGTLLSQGNGADATKIEDVGGGWYRISVTGTATASGNATVQMYSENAGSTSYTGDGATVDTSFFGAQVQPAADTTTPISSYTATNATVQTAASQADPNGTFNATEIIGDATSNTHGLTNSTTATVSSGSTYQFVSYLHAGDKTQAEMSLGGGVFAANTNVSVDLSTGSVLSTGAGADSAAVADVGGGWYRVTLTATATADGNATTDILSSDSGTGTTFTGDGVTQNTYVYDPKLVPTAAATPGSYVATTTSAVTGATATANVDGAATGADDGSVTVANNVATVNSGGAEGLQVYYSGMDFPTSATVNYTVGVGAQMYFAIDKLLDTSTGLVQTEINTLTDTNTAKQSRIDEMTVRLDIQRQSLTQRFIKMETAIAQSKQVLDQISQTTASWYNNGSSSSSGG